MVRQHGSLEQSPSGAAATAHALRVSRGAPTPAGSWAVRYSTTTHSAVQIPVGTVFLQPEALEYHGRSGTIHQLDYEDPDLLDQLQKLLDDTDARYIIPLYGED